MGAPARPLVAQLTGCRPEIVGPNVGRAASDAALVAAAVDLLVGCRIGMQILPIHYVMVGTGLTSLTNPSAPSGKAEFKVYKNPLAVPVRLSIQPVIAAGAAPTTSALFLAPSSAQIAVVGDDSGDPTVPRAQARVLSDTLFETIVLPGQSVHGVIIGPEVDEVGDLSVGITSLLDTLAALEAVRRGLSG